ncbi:MAG: hypothetical protein HWN81_13850 [Candidatus Lokiarchaeota archaeon]|nr:hypothetical protein [Candidatus Lokiarchaeota archaeon]
MPEVLELKPLKNKNLKLILIESEFPIDWWFETPEDLKEDIFWNLHLISKEYLQLIDSLIEKYKPDFALEEKPNMWNTKLNSSEPLRVLFKKRGIHFNHAEISENAELYLSSALDEHRNMIKNIEKRISELMKNNGDIPKNDDIFQRIVLWKEYLQQDYDIQEDEVRYKVREAWMMMKILNLAREVEGKKLRGIFICDLRHFNGLEKLTEELGIEIEQVKLKRTIKTEEIEQVFEKDLDVDLS